MPSGIKSRQAEELRRRVAQRKAEAETLRTLEKDPADVIDAATRGRPPLGPSAHADPVAFPAVVPRKSCAPRGVIEEGYHAVQHAQGEYVCIEAAQGGAALWCAASDGTIDICSGGATVIHSIEASPAGVGISALHATTGHMWVGGEDGTVRVYDHLVFVHITQGQFHAGPVVGFAPAADGRMFSAGEDGTVVKWDSENRGFEAMNQVVTGHQQPLTCTCFAGGRVFTGSRDGTLQAIDMDTGAKCGGLEGHTAAVVCLASVDKGRCVVSSALDATLRMWDTQSMAALGVVELGRGSSVLSMHWDGALGRLWTGEQAGHVTQWIATHHDGLRADKKVATHEQPVLCVRAVAAVEAQRIWALGSGGVNKVWRVSRNRVEERMQRVVTALKAAAAQDHRELARWGAVVRKMANATHRRRAALANMLQFRAEDNMRRKAYFALRQFTRQRQLARRNSRVSAALAQANEEAMARCFLTRWVQFARGRDGGRTKSVVVDILARNAAGSRALRAFAQMQAFVRQIHRARRNEELSKIVRGQVTRAAGRVALRKWLEFAVTRRNAARRKTFVDAMARANGDALMRLYYGRWAAISRRGAEQQRKRQVASAMMAATDSTNRRFFFQQWLAFLRRRRGAGRRQRIAACLQASSERATMATYFRKLVTFRATHAAERDEAAAAAAHESLSLVRAKYRGLQAVVEEKREIMELDDVIAAKEKELAAHEHRLQELRAQRMELLREAAAKTAKAAAAAAPKSTSAKCDPDERVSRFLLTLRGRVVNYHLDFVLVAGLRAKAERGEETPAAMAAGALEKIRDALRVACAMRDGGDAPALADAPLFRGMAWGGADAAAVGRVDAIGKMGEVSTALKTLVSAADFSPQRRLPGAVVAEIDANREALLLLTEHANMFRQRAMATGQSAAAAAAAKQEAVLAATEAAEARRAGGGGASRAGSATPLIPSHGQSTAAGRHGTRK